jgi:hypothetical protein
MSDQSLIPTDSDRVDIDVVRFMVRRDWWSVVCPTND